MKKIGIILFLLILVIPGSFSFAQTAEPGDEIYEFVTVEVKPVILNDAVPVYPQAAIDAGVEGTVVVTIVIDKNGNIMETSPRPRSSARCLNSMPQLWMPPGVKNILRE
jgi:hypothetical protein